MLPDAQFQGFLSNIEKKKKDYSLLWFYTAPHVIPSKRLQTTEQTKENCCLQILAQRNRVSTSRRFLWLAEQQCHGSTFSAITLTGLTPKMQIRWETSAVRVTTT